MTSTGYYNLKISLLSSLFGLLFTGISLQAQVGNTFPAWSEGYLDIHHISTGKGEASFLILPDGTTMLVDAGASARVRPPRPGPFPNADRTPGEWISRYILHMLTGHPEKKLDYILLTHFHSDHMGDLQYPGVTTSKNGVYQKTGITEVGDNIPFDRIIDRGWDYLAPAGGLFDNYRKFVEWQVKNNSVKTEQFQVGKNDQLTLVNKPDSYQNFEIRNIAANGLVWTGFSTNVRNHFPSIESLSRSEYPNENMSSIAFRLSYGRFNYFNGGDIVSGPTGNWRDIETSIGQVTGPVDVCVANHHAYLDAMGHSFLRATRPRIHIIQACCPTHPSSNTLRGMLSTRVYPGPRDVFSTSIMEETRVVIGPAIDNLKSQQGHIVVRVSPGGDTYMIYILDDSKESFKITAVHGPYNSN
jgi:beta-lactamase superfamily II metal-dependent hydrolase